MLRTTISCFALWMLAALALPVEAATKPIFKSKTVSANTKDGVAIDVDIRGAKQLFLVVTDAGDGYSCDWADWATPRLVGSAGEIKLTELKWKSANTGWGQVQVNKNAAGKPLSSAGKPIEYGIGTHANSVIAYDLPLGYERFQATGVLDTGGTTQGKGSSVQFLVYTKNPPRIGPTIAGGHTPEEAIDNLDVGEGLVAQLSAAEPDIVSLTNLDVDHRGRVWVCEVVNYRRNNGKRPEGDRILILEDTDQDGVMDSQKVFYQGRDIDSAIGLAVLGDKVIVSVAPNVFVFTDKDGDDVPDSKELLFTKTGRPQHDHSTHSFLFGPDGKMYWNFGNTGGQVHDKDGKIVVDVTGNEVRDSQTYKGGMVFRCNLDGSEMEVLGHNFRNNYEVTVDSFGTLWQSDNDDDGNRGVRINYVMEYGNYGYLDERSRAGWKAGRTNIEAEIPLRHWHLNDPGVVPNLLQTGAGSPTGITIYEGELLPPVFRGQMIHCDAGPSVVRAYPVQRDGAGYTAETVNVLQGTRDKWFRPVDVSVAPDGSLFVSDWYDPGVGGHGQRDLDRGRLFRVTTPEAEKYIVPKFDFDTTDGAIQALLNPNYSVRYLAWQALHAQGTKAAPALKKLYETSKNPRHRARALWLLGKIEGRGEQYVQLASGDSDADMRIVSIRLARQNGADLGPLLRKLVADDSPAVRRECAIALRHFDSAEKPQLWAELAKRYQAGDRWYLEALGIAAENDWDVCLAAWLSSTKANWNTPAGHDILWRSRAAVTPEYLVKIIHDPQVPLETVPRYFRAFDFLSGEPKNVAMLTLAFATPDEDPARLALVSQEALARLPKLDLKNNPQHAASLAKALDTMRGTSQFVELVARFNVVDRYPELLAIAQANPRDTLGVSAVKVLLDKQQQALLQTAIDGKDHAPALDTISVLSSANDARSLALLMPLVAQSEADLERRRAAVRAVAGVREGAQSLIKMAQEKKLEPTLLAAAAVPLSTSPYKELQGDVAKLFPAPKAAKGTALPPLAQLLKMKGDPVAGQKVYLKVGTCANCHQAKGQGKQVGPDLSEIGSKLSRVALYESILFPSAGVSHNYETYAVILDDGTIHTGVLTNQTDREIKIKTAEAIERTFAAAEIDELVKQPISLMPADLQNQMTAQQLADLVEWMTTLKKKE